MNYSKHALGYLVKISKDLECLLSQHCATGDSATVAVGHTEIKTVCRCDNDNGTIRPYVLAFEITIDPEGNVNSESLGAYEDETLSTSYVPKNPVNCDDVTVKGSKQLKRKIVGPVTNQGVPVGTYAESLSIVTVSGSAIITDSDNVESPLLEGESNTWTAVTNNILTPLITITLASPDDVVHVIWTEPTKQ